MTSGVGRGRGWLKISKNGQDSIRPGIVPQDEVQKTAAQNSCRVPEFPKLITQIQQLDDSDDGILFNRKINNVVLVWKEVCANENDVQDSLLHIYTVCLSDRQFLMKAMKMLYSQSFMKVFIHNVKVATKFIQYLQYSFENRVQNRMQNVHQFRNSLRILGAYLNKSQLMNTVANEMFVTPLTEYFDMLLESTHSEDFALFTEQLYLNGSKIRAVLPQKLSKIMLEVRQIVMDKELSKMSKAWLLLAIDVYGCRFGMLPSDLFGFYQNELGDKAMADFQGSPDELNIEISQLGRSLDNYSSNVNVLQLSTPEESPVNNYHSSPPHVQPPHVHNDSTSSQQSFNTTDSGVKVDMWVGAKEGNKKAGRPILGVGARLNKDNRGAGDWNDERKGTAKHRNPKGWDHDDRFERNYD